MKLVARILQILTLSLLCACSGPTALPHGSSDWLVVNGTAVTFNDPIMKSVVMVYSPYNDGSNSGSLCTGTLISDSLVLTAGHCVPPKGAKPVIYFGLNFDLSIADRPVVAYTAAEQFDDYYRAFGDKASEDKSEIDGLKVSYTDHHDLALLRFTGGLPEGFAPAKINKDPSLLKEGTKVYVLGYGRSNQSDLKSGGTLRKGEVSIFIPDFNSGELAIDQTNKNGLCQGDSGSGAYIKVGDEFQLIAVMSRTLSGAKNPGSCEVVSVLSSIIKQLDWIKAASEKIPLPAQPPVAAAPSSH